MASPYRRASVERWPRVTKRLVAAHPLTADQPVEVVLSAWKSIFASRFGTTGLRIGRDIFPSPQIMGFLLHEIIAADLERTHPELWAGGKGSTDKDLMYIPDARFSVEIKTSSHARQVFGKPELRAGAEHTEEGQVGLLLGGQLREVAQ